MKLPRSYVGSMLIVGILAGCGGDTTGPDPQDPALSSVSGNNQSATPGQALANLLVVLMAQDGSGVSGKTVSWTVSTGGGSVNPASSTTDNSGMASTQWTLGPDAGPNSVQASGSGVTGSPVTFAATGVSDDPPPATASISVGDNFFNPDSQTLAAGGAVTWTWAGSFNHNVTFSTGSDNSATQSGGTFTRTFADVGSFDYLCTIHGSAMSGTIVVQ